MTAQVAADLRAAAEVLRRDGWIQGELHSPEGCHCLAGAVEVVIDPAWDKPIGWDDEQNNRYRAAIDRIVRQIGDNPVAAWNDWPGRTADEVIAALEAAADAADPPDCIHLTSCEIGDHTRSWPCDYAPGTGSLAAEAQS